jgi:heptosyltransferase I
VDRFEQAARKFRDSDAADLRWGTRIEQPGVMDLIQPADVFERMLAWKNRS